MIFRIELKKMINGETGVIVTEIEKERKDHVREKKKMKTINTFANI